MNRIHCTSKPTIHWLPAILVTQISDMNDRQTCQTRGEFESISCAWRHRPTSAPCGNTAAREQVDRNQYSRCFHTPIESFKSKLTYRYLVTPLVELVHLLSHPVPVPVNRRNGEKRDKMSLFQSALDFLAGPGGSVGAASRDQNDFVGQVVELGDLKLRIKRVIAEGKRIIQNSIRLVMLTWVYVTNMYFI